MAQVPQKTPNQVTLDTTMGPALVELLARKDVTEAYCNDDGTVWYISQTEGKVRSSIVLPEERRMAVIRLCAGQAGKIIDSNVPDISCEIDGYGYRFQGEIPPIVRSPQFNIRKKALLVFPLSSYVESGSLTIGYKNYIEHAIKDRKNILVSGGTGTGKTTFLNALLLDMAEISPDHRIISLEDLPELQCPAEDYSPMYTMQDTGDPHKKVYNMTRLLASCMRRSPDRIIVGEVRDGAAYSMLKAWNTGHPGGVCTTHADNALFALTRIENLAREDPSCESLSEEALRNLIGEAINVVISIEHKVLPNGVRTRVISEILEVHGYDALKHQYRTVPVDPQIRIEPVIRKKE